MKQNLMIAILPVVSVSFVFGYTVTCLAQSPSNREDQEAIKKVIVGTTEAFNKHDAKAFTRFYTPDAEWLPSKTQTGHLMASKTGQLHLLLTGLLFGIARH